MKSGHFLNLCGLAFLLLFFAGCTPNQYGVANYNFNQNKKVKKAEKTAAHGSANRISSRDERKRIKYYNNPEYKRKLLEKRRKKQENSPIDQAKSR